jgi:hypothetical protein
MAWYIIYQTSDGVNVSEAGALSEIVSPLPAGLTISTLASKPDWVAQMWDAASRSIVARPPAPKSQETLDAEALVAKSNWSNADIAAYQKLLLKALLRDIAARG